MMRVLRNFIAILLCAAALSASALEGSTLTLTQAQELFRAGNAAYQQQHYTDARANYLQLADAGIVSPELFYNLGNASARLNKKGEAVLYFTRARELDPHDPDILANLRRVAPSGVVNSVSLTHPLRWTANQLSLREWITLFLALFFLAGVCGGIYLASPTRPRPLRNLFIISLTATALVSLFGGYRYHETYYVQYATVLQPGASVRSGPADKFAQVDTLPEGEIVKRLGTTEDEWAEVQLSDGRKGYMQAKSILLI
jgi:tetratricopeptide (TPR) repeat protein